MDRDTDDKRESPPFCIRDSGWLAFAFFNRHAVALILVPLKSCKYFSRRGLRLPDQTVDFRIRCLVTMPTGCFTIRTLFPTYMCQVLMKSSSRDAPDVLPAISPAHENITGRRITQRRTGAGSMRQGPRISWRLPLSAPLLLVLVVSLGLGGAVWLLQGKLEKLQTQLVATERQLVEMSGAVSATGQSVDRNEAQLGARLKALDFEIRKLWDLTNKRNRPLIAQQGQQLDTLKKDVQFLSKLNKQQVTALANNKAMSEKLAGSVAVLKKEVAAVKTEQLAGAALDNEHILALEKSVDDLSEKVGSSTNVEDRLGNLSERMDAVDGYRQQVSRRLLQLEQSLRSLQAGGSAPVRSPGS